MSELKKKFISEKLEAAWKMLKPQLKKERLIWVSKDCDLVEVALAVASDDATAVNTWLTSKQIGQPISEQIDSWDQEESQFFWMLIVQPFILIQEMNEEELAVFQKSQQVKPSADGYKQ